MPDPFRWKAFHRNGKLEGDRFGRIGRLSFHEF